MENGVIGMIIIAFLGPVLVYLTRYVLKGRAAVASRLWFVAFCSYVVFYFLAKDNYISTPIESFYFALLWPIPAILAFWLTERIGGKQSPIPFFRWTVYFLAGVIFALVLDTAGTAAGWFSYTASTTTLAVTNPLTGAQEPAIVPLLLGVYMIGVFFLVDNAFDFLKKRIGRTTALYVLIGLSFVMGGLIWVAFELIMGLFK